MNLFFTGGTGFFGKSILRYWQNHSPKFERIFILSRNPEAFLASYADLLTDLNVNFIEGDILDISKINLDIKFDYIIHAATESSLGSRINNFDLFSQIVRGTEEVLQFAVNHGCKKFLLTSSGAVYGIQPKNMEKIPEDYLGSINQLDPNSAYGIGKKAAEHLTILYANKFGFDYVIARCFAFVGEDLPLNAHFAIGNFLRDSINDRDLTVNGDGSPLRSYFNQNDLAYCLNLMLFMKTKYKVYNVGSDVKISIKDLAAMIRDKVNPRKKIIVKAKRDSNLKNKYIPNVDRLRAEFFPDDFMHLDESLDEIISKLLK